MANSRAAWVYPRGKSWYVGWVEPSTGERVGKSFGAKKTDANNFCKEKTAELIKGISQGFVVKGWDAFVDQFIEIKGPGLSPKSLETYKVGWANFKRLAEPRNVSDINKLTIDRFVAARLAERGKKEGSKTSAATVNKDLRAVKLLLRQAHEWNMLLKVPKIDFVREPDVEPTFVSEADFALLYGACDAATRPSVPNVDPADWWRAFLLFSYMTGWRVSEPIKLLWEDVDLEGGYAITRAADNKGKKEAKVPLHPIVIEHLKTIKTFSREVFPWPLDGKQLWVELHKIQAKAGIKKVCRKDHPHNEACERYGFHDLRRGFATANAANLTASQLQVLMRHQSYTTTQRYIAMAEQAKQSDIASRLTVPVLNKEAK